MVAPTFITLVGLSIATYASRLDAGNVIYPCGYTFDPSTNFQFGLSCTGNLVIARWGIEFYFDETNFPDMNSTILRNYRLDSLFIDSDNSLKVSYDDGINAKQTTPLFINPTGCTSSPAYISISGSNLNFVDGCQNVTTVFAPSSGNMFNYRGFGNLFNSMNSGDFDSTIYSDYIQSSNTGQGVTVYVLDDIYNPYNELSLPLANATAFDFRYLPDSTGNAANPNLFNSYVPYSDHASLAMNILGSRFIGLLPNADLVHGSIITNYTIDTVTSLITPKFNETSLIQAFINVVKDPVPSATARKIINLSVAYPTETTYSECAYQIMADYYNITVIGSAGNGGAYIASANPYIFVAGGYTLNRRMCVGGGRGLLYTCNGNTLTNVSKTGNSYLCGSDRIQFATDIGSNYGTPVDMWAPVEMVGNKHKGTSLSTIYTTSMMGYAMSNVKPDGNTATFKNTRFWYSMMNMYGNARMGSNTSPFIYSGTKSNNACKTVGVSSLSPNAGGEIPSLTFASNVNVTAVSANMYTGSADYCSSIIGSNWKKSGVEPLSALLQNALAGTNGPVVWGRTVTTQICSPNKKNGLRWRGPSESRF